MKGKRFLARSEPLTLSLLLSCFVHCACALIMKFLVPIEEQEWTALIFLTIFCLAICIPYVLILGSSTITLYEDRFCYKKRLFSKKKWMKYDDITQLYIDFCNYPVGVSGQRAPKSIYINSATATECQVNITYKLIAEFRKHVDKKRIHVNFESLLSFRKKFREQLGDCLTMWQKIELKQKLGNKKKRH